MRSFQRILMSEKLRQEVYQVTNRKEGGVSSPRGCLHKDWATNSICPPGKTPQHACTLCEQIHVRDL